MKQEIAVVVVHAHRRPVHGLDHHAVYAEGLDAGLPPTRLLLLGREGEGPEEILLGRELPEEEVRELRGQLLLRPALFVHAVGLAARLRAASSLIS